MDGFYWDNVNLYPLSDSNSRSAMRGMCRHVGGGTTIILAPLVLLELHKMQASSEIVGPVLADLAANWTYAQDLLRSSIRRQQSLTDIRNDASTFPLVHRFVTHQFLSVILIKLRRVKESKVQRSIRTRQDALGRPFTGTIKEILRMLLGILEKRAAFDSHPWPQNDDERMLEKMWSPDAMLPIVSSKITSPLAGLNKYGCVSKIREDGYAAWHVLLLHMKRMWTASRVSLDHIDHATFDLFSTIPTDFDPTEMAMLRATFAFLPDTDKVTGTMHPRPSLATICRLIHTYHLSSTIECGNSDPVERRVGAILARIHGRSAEVMSAVREMVDAQAAQRKQNIVEYVKKPLRGFRQAARGKQFTFTMTAGPTLVLPPKPPVHSQYHLTERRGDRSSSKFRYRSPPVDLSPAPSFLLPPRPINLLPQRALPLKLDPKTALSTVLTFHEGAGYDSDIQWLARWLGRYRREKRKRRSTVVVYITVLLPLVTTIDEPRTSFFQPKYAYIYAITCRKRNPE
ncbi:hypothetical protein BCR39DRAFT_525802 [Naematelia encephala]|uniref:Uncharacterized protein n=1 Tax=Naematelia encephala TaxID=71784 RepID=A0A1Y2B9T0_9TREE|nr:hypothetical protein BCR39DRAFT_525802 [Naematelia encephala]